MQQALSQRGSSEREDRPSVHSEVQLQSPVTIQLLGSYFLGCYEEQKIRKTVD